MITQRTRLKCLADCFLYNRVRVPYVTATVTTVANHFKPQRWLGITCGYAIEEVETSEEVVIPCVHVTRDDEPMRLQYELRYVAPCHCVVRNPRIHLGADIQENLAEFDDAYGSAGAALDAGDTLRLTYKLEASCAS